MADQSASDAGRRQDGCWLLPTLRTDCKKQQIASSEAVGRLPFVKECHELADVSQERCSDRRD